MVKNKAPLLSSLLLVLLLSGCMGVKHGGGTTPAGKLMEEFFVKPGVMQYFIKPLSWKMEESKSLVTTDFTFRDSAGVKSPVTCNFTVVDFPADSVQVGESSTAFKAKTSTLFEEKNDGLPRYRYSVQMPIASFQQLIQAGAPLQLISPSRNGKRERKTALPSGKTRKRFKKLALTFF